VGKRSHFLAPGNTIPLEHQIREVTPVAKLLKAEEVRERLGLRTVHTIYKWVRVGRLPAVQLSSRTWRFREEDLEEFIRQHMSGPGHD
jgi:excisionase family DNA binding protein